MVFVKLCTFSFSFSDFFSYALSSKESGEELRQTLIFLCDYLESEHLLCIKLLCSHLNFTFLVIFLYFLFQFNSFENTSCSCSIKSKARGDIKYNKSMGKYLDNLVTIRLCLHKRWKFKSLAQKQIRDRWINGFCVSSNCAFRFGWLLVLHLSHFLETINICLFWRVSKFRCSVKYYFFALSERILVKLFWEPFLELLTYVLDWTKSIKHKVWWMNE